MKNEEYNLIHGWLIEQFKSAKDRNTLAHKNNDTLKKERARGEMMAFKKAITKAQELRKILTA